MTITIIFIVLVVLVVLIRLLPSLYTTDDAAKRLFVCRTCGHEFYPKWYEMYFFGWWSVQLRGEARLRCPCCKTKERCSEVITTG